jgi:hypothetical protein
VQPVHENYHIVVLPPLFLRPNLAVRFLTIKPFIMSTSIPAFHVSDFSKVKGGGDIFIQSRADAVSSGVFTVKISAQFDPAADDYPAGSLTIKTDLSDSVKALFKASSIELINSYGKHNPTVYLTGRCTAESGDAPKGCRYWIMIANNKKANDPKGTPDIVGFAIHDRNGNRVAYGTGPVKSGDFDIAPK